jgi:ferritin-like metal-binding protein YciE
MHMQDLQDLYVEELRDLYNAEKQLVKALPKMAKKASHDELKEAFTTHLDETKGHVERLEEIFGKLGKRAGGKTCKAMQGIVEEGKEMMEEDAEPEVLDAALIAAAQRAEHYEIAAYGTVRTYAKLLGDKQAAKLLQSTLDEEGKTDKLLTQIAENSINVDAQQPA